MYKRKKKNTAITVGIIAVALALVLGVVAVLSSGFQNMDARDWVNGYQYNLKIGSKVQSSDKWSESDGNFKGKDHFEWKMNGRTVIVSSEDVEASTDTSVMLLHNNDDELFKNKEDSFALTSKVALKDNDTAYGEVGYVFAHEQAQIFADGAGDFAIAILLDYDSEEDCMRVVFGSISFAGFVVKQSSVYHDLSWFGIYDINNVKFNVTFNYTEDGVKLDVTVGNKIVSPYETAMEHEVGDNKELYEDWFYATSQLNDPNQMGELLDYSVVNVGAYVCGTQAQFKDVQAK